MNRTRVSLVILGAVVTGLSAPLAVQYARAQAPTKPDKPTSDECATIPPNLYGTACEHKFTDGTICVMWARSATSDSQMACKIVNNMKIPADPTISVS